MSFGSGPFGAGPFGGANPPPGDEGIAALSSSRRIDGVTRRYVITPDGGFAPMDDVAQRVLLLIAFGVPEQTVITPQALSTTEADIRAALKPLTEGAQPTIRLIKVLAERTGPGRTARTVIYTNLLTGTQTTLTPDGQVIST